MPKETNEVDAEGGAIWISFKQWERIVKATVGGSAHFASSKSVADYLESNATASNTKAAPLPLTPE